MANINTKAQPTSQSGNAAKLPVSSSGLTRLDLGNAWMWCAECGAKLWEFDDYEDQSRRCPYKKNADGSCSGEVR